MRPAARWSTAVAVLAAAAAPGLVSAAPAYADGGAVVVSSTNWYWSGSDGPASTTPVGAGPFAAPAPASGIPDGDLGVAYTNDVDKVAALDFLLTSIPDGSTVSRFAITMPLDSTATNLKSATPELVACAAIAPFEPSAGPSPLSKQPAQAPNTCVDGKPDTAGTSYVFDVAPFADDWASGAPANGVVIRPKSTTTTPFNLAFLGRNAIKVDVAFSAPVSTATAPVAPTAPVDGAGVAQPPSGFSGDSGVAPVSPVAPVTAPVTAPAPQVLPPAAPVVAAPATRAAALRPTVDALRPDGLFWLGALGAGALLLLAGLVFGDPMEPVVVDPRRRRFADVVRARVAARAAAAGAEPRSAAPRARPA